MSTCFPPMPIDPYNLDESKLPPLWNALNERDFLEAQRLIAEGACLDDIIEEGGDTFLHRAAQENHLQMVKFYLDHDCPKTIESFDYIAQTPLIRASAHGHTEVVVRLLSARANP